MGCLKAEASRFEREKQPFAVALFDLDHFKKINDQYGHVTGDHVLKEISTRIRESIRPYDLIGRYGGEEFLLILPGCDMSAATRQTERLRLRIAEAPISYESHSIHVTVSIGVTVYCGGEMRLEDIIGVADRALYQAKSNGRNQIVTTDMGKVLEINTGYIL